VEKRRYWGEEGKRCLCRTDEGIDRPRKGKSACNPRKKSRGRGSRARGGWVGKNRAGELELFSLGKSVRREVRCKGSELKTQPEYDLSQGERGDQLTNLEPSVPVTPAVGGCTENSSSSAT